MSDNEIYTDEEYLDTACLSDDDELPNTCGIKDQDEGLNTHRSRNVWDTKETEALCETAYEMDIVSMLDSKQHRRSEVFQSLADKFTELGYNRNWKQVMFKYQALKADYMSTQKPLKKSGAGTAAIKKCKHYENLHKLFSTRPVVNQQKFDSITMSGSLKRKISENHNDKAASETDPAKPSTNSLKSSSSVSDGARKYRKYSSTRSGVPFHEIANHFIHQVSKTQLEFMQKNQAWGAQMLDKSINANAANINSILQGLREIYSSPQSQFLPPQQSYPPVQQQFLPSQQLYPTQMPWPYPNVYSSFSSTTFPEALAGSSAPSRTVGIPVRSPNGTDKGQLQRDHNKENIDEKPEEYEDE